jgi:septin family protein
LTLWDSQGLEKNLVDLQLKEMISFLESKFEDTFTEEMKVIRSPGVQDTHIHCVFLILDPSRLDMNMAAAKIAAEQNGNGKTEENFPLGPKIIGGLDKDLDLQVIRALQGKTTVIPVISKADTITTAHMTHLKRMVADSLKKANLDPMEALGLNDFDDSNRDSILDEKDEDEANANGASSDDELREMASKPAEEPSSNPYFPLSIISPDLYDPGTIGRKFPWGFADPYNPEHCDFLRLKEAVFSEWRGELREASREVWYEGWRTSRLRRRDA